MTAVPGHVLVDAVEAGLRLVFAVAGQVEGEQAQRLGSLGRRSRDLDELKERETQRDKLVHDGRRQSVISEQQTAAMNNRPLLWTLFPTVEPNRPFLWRKQYNYF